MAARLPSIGDTISIVDVVRRRGSVHYPVELVPGDFVRWRRKIRLEAKRTGMKVSVIRSSGLVLVYNPDHEQTDDQIHASADVMQGEFTDAPVTYDEALRKRARKRLRVVPDGD
jgi:hypothetical protein